MRRIPVLLIAAALLLSACGDATPYAAKVNGERITVDDLNRELKAVKGNPKYIELLQQERRGRIQVEGTGVAETYGSAFVAETLTVRIYYRLIGQEVRRRKLPVTDEEVGRARESLEQSFGPDVVGAFPKRFVDELARANAEVEVLQQTLQRQQVTPQQIEAFYRENPQFFKQYCTAQIVTGGFSGDGPPPPDQEAAAKAVADDIKRRLDTGQDFAAIARAESKDTGTAANGGDMGCVAENAFPPESRRAVTEAQPGQVVGPIRTDRGFYLVKVNSSKTQPLEEVQSAISQYLEQQAGDPISGFLQKALAEAHIEVNPRYGTFAKEPRPGVVPPDVPATSTTAPAEEEAPSQ